MPHMNSSSKKPRLIVVEIKNMAYDGHYYTQISALQSLLPTYDVHLIVGSSYDGKLGPAAATVERCDLKRAKYNFELKYGSLGTRAIAFFKLIIRGLVFKSQKSAYASHLYNVCNELQMETDDLIIVPSGRWIDLFSVGEFAFKMGARAPNLVIRILDPSISVGNADMWARLSKEIGKETDSILPSQVQIYSETEELADYLTEKWQRKIQGGFYLPCTISQDLQDIAPKSLNSSFKVGVFGQARDEKGSDLVVPIIKSLVGKLDGDEQQNIEFLIQGSDADFDKNGYFDGINVAVDGQNKISYTQLQDALSPEEFEIIFRSIDVILIPYDVRIYDLRGSGIIQDALLGRKAIVYSEGISMKRFLENGNAIAANSTNEFADAILYLQNHADSVKQGTDEAFDVYCECIDNHPLRKMYGNR